MTKRKKARERHLIERGIFLVKQQSGKTAYWVQITVNKKRYQSMAPNLERARQIRDSWLTEGPPVAGEKPAVPPSQDEEPGTVRDAIRWYQSDCTQRRALPTAELTGHVLRAWARDAEMIEWLAMPLPAVDTAAIQEWLDARLERGRVARTGQPLKLSSVLREYRIVRAALKPFRAELRWPRLGKSLKESQKPVRPMTPPQKAALLMALAEPYRRIVKLAMLFNPREASLAAIRTEHLHLDEATPWVWLPTAKQGEEKAPLGRRAVALFREQLAANPADCPWVFPSPYRGYTTPLTGAHLYDKLKVAARAIGRPDLTFHDLRHQFATELLAAGYNLAEIQRIGRWSSDAVQRYLHMEADDIAAAQDVIGGSHPIQRRRAQTIPVGTLRKISRKSPGR